MVRGIIKLEGLASFIAGTLLYFLAGGGWLSFTLLFFLPDISMVGYLKDKNLGSFTYNLVHNYAFSAIFIFIGYFLEVTFVLYTGFILLAHIGIDRFLGYGLKYRNDFKSTHIQKL